MPLYTRDEVAVHNTADDCWLIISGRVYDVTSWIADHPGGSRVVSAQAGLDVSQLFASFHDASVLETVAAPFLIGSITGKEEEEHRQGQDGEKEAGQSADRQREQVVAGGVYAGAETAHSKGAATISGLQLSHRSAGGGQSQIDVTISAEELAALKNISELETLAKRRLPSPAALFIAYLTSAAPIAGPVSASCMLCCCTYLLSAISCCSLLHAIDFLCGCCSAPLVLARAGTGRRTRRARSPIKPAGLVSRCGRASPSVATSRASPSGPPCSVESLRCP
jgi:hypothetical protein